MLCADAAPDQREIGARTAKLVSECRDLLSALLPLEENEREFVARLNERGEIVPSPITGDPTLLDIIQRRPSLRWKAVNVRHHRGIPLEGIEDEMA